MKKDDLKKLRDKQIVDLEKDIYDSREKLRTLIFDLASGKVKNSSVSRDVKKHIARLETLIREKNIETSNKSK